jgi:hypothetical protein
MTNNDRTFSSNNHIIYSMCVGTMTEAPHRPKKRVKLIYTRNTDITGIKTERRKPVTRTRSALGA